MDFSLPAGATGQIASSSSEFIGSIAPVATLIIGLLLAFLIIEAIIGVFHKEK